MQPVAIESPRIAIHRIAAKRRGHATCDCVDWFSGLIAIDSRQAVKHRGIAASALAASAIGGPEEVALDRAVIGEGPGGFDGVAVRSPAGFEPAACRLGYIISVDNFLSEEDALHCEVRFPAQWMDASPFESTLRSSFGAHEYRALKVAFRFPTGCKVMVDAAIRLLSLVNQLTFRGRRVSLDFEEGETGTMGYLDRMGFFDHLAPEIEVLPARPRYSRADRYRGSNRSLVEIARINKDARDEELPTRLTNTLMHYCRSRSDASELEGAAWTIFAELIENIFAHSRTRFDGYAALQAYLGDNRLLVAVSDSGLGIIKTLRPSLQAEFPRLAALSDTDLLVQVFRQGLSRHGVDRGCGLKGSAAKAIKFGAILDVRLPNQRVLLAPAQGVYQPNRAYCYEGLPLIWGTHIAFGFDLGA